MFKVLMKIKDNINIFIIVAIILLSGLLIGTPIIESNIYPVYIISGVFSIFYYIIKVIIKREKIIQDKIDVCIVILTFSTLIPLVFKTYVSLSGTIYSIMKYFCILNIVLITKNECRKNPKYKHIILNTILISILILCIFGLDEISGNRLEEFKKIIGYKSTQEEELRIGSLFSYANAIAIIAGAGVFLCIGYVSACKSIIIKLIYLLISIIMLITMILTYSRLVLIIFALMSVLYVLILCKKYKVKEKINKKFIWSVVIIICVFVIYVIIAMQLPTKLVVKERYQRRFFDIEPQTEYKFEFEIEATSKIKNNFVIQIVEMSEYIDKLNIVEFKFDNFNGRKEFSIKTQEETALIYVYISRKEEQGECIINKMTLNGEEQIINYKLLPANLVFKVQEISFSQKSAWERMVFIQDAFKQIKKNWLFGLGGGAWRTVQLESQEYNYYAKEVHSFPIQIFLENGIMGVIACLGLVVYIIKILYKEIRKQEINLFKISIIMGMVIILVHSILDFTMSFFYVILIDFLILATKDEKKHEQNEKVLQRIFCIILIIASFVTIYIAVIEMDYNKHKELIILNYGETELDFYEKYYNLIPYNTQVNEKMNYFLSIEESIENGKKRKEILKNILKYEKFSNANLNLENVYYYIKLSIEDENVDESLNFALKYIIDTENFSRYKAEFQISRLRNLKRIVELLYNENELEYAQKFNEQFTKEICEKEKFILDYQKSRYSKERTKEYKEILENLK